jgi:hypothetical protein
MSSSSDGEGLIPDTSWDEEFTKKLLSDLNHEVLGPPGDGKIIILSDSDEEEEEVREEIITDTNVAPSSAIGILDSTASTTDIDDVLKEVRNDNSDDHTAD